MVELCPDRTIKKDGFTVGRLLEDDDGAYFSITNSLLSGEELDFLWEQYEEQIDHFSNL